MSFQYTQEHIQKLHVSSFLQSLYFLGWIFNIHMFPTSQLVPSWSSWSQAWLAVKGGITVPEFTGFVSLLSSLAAPSISLGSFYRVAVTWFRNMRQQLWNGDHLSLLILFCTIYTQNVSCLQISLVFPKH